MNPMSSTNPPLEAVLAVIGLVIGSFLNVVIHRVPLRQSLWHPPSSCPLCGTRILWYHNVPVWGYLMLKGRCRSCGQPISLVYPMVELTSAAFLVALYVVIGWSIAYLKYTFLGLLLFVLTVIDWRHRIIPDRLLIFGVPVAVTFLMLEGPAAIMDGVIGMVVGGSAMWSIAAFGRMIYRTDAMGGGDIKLIAMLGLFLGWKLLLVAVLCSFLLISATGWLGVLFGKLDRRSEIPMAPFFGLSTMGSLGFGYDMIEWYLSTFLK